MRVVLCRTNFLLPLLRYEVKASPGHGQPSLEIYRDPRATSQLLQQLLQQTTARRKGRGSFIPVAGFVIPLVALFVWGVEAMIQPAGNEQIPPLAETADPMVGSGSADGGQPPVEIHLEAPQPQIVSEQFPLAAAFDNAQPNAASPTIDSVTSWVRLGAFRNPENARTMWLKLRRTQSDLLSDLQHKIWPVDREGRDKLHFLQVGPLNATEAKMLCHDLAERNIDCLAVLRKP